MAENRASAAREGQKQKHKVTPNAPSPCPRKFSVCVCVGKYPLSWKPTSGIGAIDPQSALPLSDFALRRENFDAAGAKLRNGLADIRSKACRSESFTNSEKVVPRFCHLRLGGRSHARPGHVAACPWQVWTTSSPGPSLVAATACAAKLVWGRKRQMRDTGVGRSGGSHGAIWTEGIGCLMRRPLLMSSRYCWFSLVIVSRF